MAPQRRQDHDGLLLHFQQVPQNGGSLVVVALGHRIRHFEDLRRQHRVRHRVNVPLGDDFPLGVGADLGDLLRKPRHQSAAEENQILRRLPVDLLPQRPEPPCDPRRQVRGVLRLELNGRHMGVHGLAQLLHSLVLLVSHRIVHKHDAAVFRQILQQGDEPLPLILVQLVDVPVRHHDQRPLRHHRHSLRHFRQALGRQVLAFQSVIVEFLKSGRDQSFPDLPQVIFPEIALLSVKEVGVPQRVPLFQICFQFLIGFVLRRFFCVCHDVLLIK